MRRLPIWSLLPLLAACDARISAAGDPGSIDALPADAATPDTAATMDADPLGAWGPPTPIGVAATTASGEDDATLSSNGLEMIFAIDGLKGKDLYYTSRNSLSDKWKAISRLDLLDNADFSDETPRLSADDKTLYFASGRLNNGNALEIFMSMRSAAGKLDWSTPTRIGSASTPQIDKWYMPCGTHYIMVQSTATNDLDLFEGVIGAAAAPITELNRKGGETGTFLSKDCLTIYFASTGDVVGAPPRLYMSTRDAIDSKWKPPTPVTQFPIGGSLDGQEDPWMSSDLRTFVFASSAAGTKDIYLSTR